MLGKTGRPFTKTAAAVAAAAAALVMTCADSRRSVVDWTLQQRPIVKRFHGGYLANEARASLRRRHFHWLGRTGPLFFDERTKKGGAFGPSAKRTFGAFAAHLSCSYDDNAQCQQQDDMQSQCQAQSYSPIQTVKLPIYNPTRQVGHYFKLDHFD